MINNSPNVGVFYAVYNSSVLFPVSGNEDTSAQRQTQVVSSVIAATVGQNMTFQDLLEPVTIVLRIKGKVRLSFVN